jgi:hypothetical protein
LDYERAICGKLLQSILDVPCARVFWSHQTPQFNDRAAHPLTFELISSRLSQGLYRAADGFVGDVRTLLHNARACESGFRLEAAKYLYNLVESLLVERPPYVGPCADALRCAETRIHKLQHQCRVVPPQPPTDGREPAAEALKPQWPECSNAALRCQLRLIATEELCYRVVRFVIDKQPECVVIGDDEEVSFRFDLMKHATKKALHEFMSKLIRDAAAGVLQAPARKRS